MRTTFQIRLALAMGLLVAGTVFVMTVLVVWNAVGNIMRHYEAMTVSYSEIATRYVRDSAELYEEEAERASENMARAKVDLEQTLRTSGAIPPGQSWDAFSALLEQSLKDLQETVLPPYSVQTSLDQVYRRLNAARGAVIDAQGNVLAQAGFEPDGGTVPPAVIEMASHLLGNPKQQFLSDRFGREIGVVTRLELPHREPVALFLQHRMEHGRALIRDTVTYVAIFSMALIAGALAIVWRMSRKLSRPIRALARGMRELGDGNLDFELQLETRDEIQEVAQAVGDMVGNLRTAMDELEQETLRRERLEHELHIASELQSALLPEAPPTLEGLDLLGWSRTAKEVGGDFYDFVELGPTRLAIAIGDASGKGLPAALLVTECWSVLRTLSEEALSPAELLYRTNNALSRRVRATGRFVTLFFGILELEHGRFRYASAGHNPPVLIGAEDGRRLRLQADEGFPLGIVSGARYSEHEVVLHDGDTLLLYSDGLTEAQDPEGRLYGEARMEGMVAQLAERPLLELLAGIKQDMDDHVRDAEIYDDVTLVGARYHGA